MKTTVKGWAFDAVLMRGVLNLFVPLYLKISATSVILERKENSIKMIFQLSATSVLPCLTILSVCMMIHLVLNLDYVA
jgi:hypothetical protein